MLISGGSLSHKTTHVQARRGFRLLTLAFIYIVTIVSIKNIECADTQQQAEQKFRNATQMRHERKKSAGIINLLYGKEAILCVRKDLRWKEKDWVMKDRSE